MTPPPSPLVRAATAADVPALFALVQALARYEKLEDQVTGTEADLAAHLFSEPPGRRHAEALVAQAAPGAGDVVGFALFFHNYSTFLARPGLYLEDLFVLPAHRRQGHGRALLSALARIAVERRCGRLEWSVLDWNEPAIRFYESLGARKLDEWTTFRMTGASIERLASE